MRYFKTSSVLILIPMVLGAGQASGDRLNVALNAPYVLEPAPNYGHCTDPGDATQLTDGELTEGHFWTQTGTVGWQRVKYVTVTVDLGRIEPIAGVSFRTAAGIAGVGWPCAIRIHVSDDGELYRDVGDLLELDGSARPPPEGYAVRRLETLRFKAHGRYVRFFIFPVGPYVFCDEIEVLRGDDAWLDLVTAGEPVGDVEEQYLRYRVKTGIRLRFDNDLARLREIITAMEVEQGANDAILDDLRDRLNRSAQSVDPAKFRAILPLTVEHTDLFVTQAALWRDGGHADLTVWTVCPWDPLDLFAPPSTEPTAPLEVHTMRGEYRSAAFNLANSTDETINATVRFEDLTGSPQPGYVTAYEVPWTDTVSGTPVAAALVEARSSAKGWAIRCAPGLVQQVWLTFHVTDLPPGVHDGRVVISSFGRDDLTIPLSLHVYPLTFPEKTTLQVGGWSYTDGHGYYGVTPGNRRALVTYLREHFVNAPWATAQVMMKFTFQEGSDPPIKLDTSILDEWLAQWPDAQKYYVFLSVGRTFAGTTLGTPEFDQHVGSWISAWVAHLAGKDVAADRLGLLLVDEPRNPEQDEVIIAWAKAIKAAEPDVLIWEDPIYTAPKEGMAGMYAICDVLCPNRPMWLGADSSFADFYRDQQKQGRTLQLYSCSGPARLLDPYAYYRLQAWHCWAIGATGSFFWAFGDNGRASSWNEYASTGGPYTPLFLDDTSVNGAKQMEAIRESVEDYEYFVMLKHAVQRAEAEGRDSATLRKARSLLDKAANGVLSAPAVNDLTWHAAKDRSIADHIRVQLLQCLAQLAGDMDG